MGRRKGEPKETVAVRLTPDARIKINQIKLSRARSAAFNGSRRSFTNSLIIEHAIQMYYKQWDISLKHPDTCGACGQKRLY